MENEIRSNPECWNCFKKHKISIDMDLSIGMYVRQAARVVMLSMIQACVQHTAEEGDLHVIGLSLGHTTQCESPAGWAGA